MFWIHPKELLLTTKSQIKSIYILFGNDLCMLQDTQLHILKKICILYSVEKLQLELDINSNWNKIFHFCRTQSLFSKKKILLLNFPKDYPINDISKNIPILASFINADLILNLAIYTTNQPSQHTKWIKFLNNTAIFINCITPEHSQLETWIQNQSKYMKLNIENLACQLLCYYYEGNQILLKQILQYLSLIYPDGNLDFLRIKNIINDSAFFDYNHWIESLLQGKKKRANRVLKKLEHINFNWKILLYKIQIEILIIIQMKYSLMQKQSVSLLLKKYQVYTQYRRLILFKATQRFTVQQLQLVLSLLVNMEIKYHQQCIYLTRFHFEMITEILCNTNNNIQMQQFFMNTII